MLIVQAVGCDIKVWGMFSWEAPSTLIPINYCLRGYLSIVVDLVHSLMTTFH